MEIDRDTLGKVMAEDRLDRVEQKLDAVNDKLSAFPVVGQRIADMERRVGRIESDVHDLHKKASSNALSLAKIGGIATVLAVIGAVVARQIIKL